MTIQYNQLMEGYYFAKRRTTQLLINKYVSILILFLIILPAILGLIYIKLFSTNVVFWDQWFLVPLIEKLYSGTLSLYDLFAQHNEHRLIFPRIIMLIIAYITNYNTVIEMYFAWILAVITLALMLKMYTQDFGNSTSSLMKFVPIAWIMFSFRQYENILWGWQIQIYLAVLGFVVSIYMLEKSEKKHHYFFIAILSGIVSTFSFMNGLFVWPVGFIFIILSKMKHKKVFIIAWALTGLIVCIAFFYNWVKPSYHPSLSFVEENPVIGLKFLIINIGSPLAFEQSQALLMGIALVISMIVILHLIIKNRLINKNAKWISFILFSLMTSLALTIGRSGFGVGQALASRYVTFTMLGIVGLYLITLDIYNKKIKIVRSLNFAILYWMIVSVIFIGIIIGYTGGIKMGEIEIASRGLIVNDLINYKWVDDENLRQIFPNSDVVRFNRTQFSEYARILEKYKLNVFYSTKASNLSNQSYDWNLLKRVKGGIMSIDIINKKEYIDSVNGNIVKEQVISMNGWAVDDKAKDGTVKTFLVFSDENEEVIFPTAKIIRSDLADSFNIESYITSGWSATVSTKQFKDQCYDISLRIVRANGKEYYELSGNRSICWMK